MKPISIAALVAVALTLSACSGDDIEYFTALAKGEPVPDYTEGSLAITAMLEEEPRYYETGETGPMGEVVAGGVDCQPAFRVRMCL
jgi:hypothetical protein